jgi:putative transposase
MPKGLKRYHRNDYLHFLTCSCYHRQPWLASPRRRDLFLEILEEVWQRRFYDFHVSSERKRIEKLRYMHRNPIRDGLAQAPEQWAWSSYRSYANGEEGIVRINHWPKAEMHIRPAA